MIRSRPRAPPREPPRAIERFCLWTAPGSTEVAIAGDTLNEEVLDDEVLDDGEVLDDEKMLDDEVLDDEEVLDEDVAEDEAGLISVYLYPKSVEEIGIINERTQTLERLRSQNFALAQRIIRAYVVYSSTPWSSRRHCMVQSRLTLYLAHCDHIGR